MPPSPASRSTATHSHTGYYLAFQRLPHHFGIPSPITSSASSHFWPTVSPHRLADVLAIMNDTPHFTLSTFTNTSATYADTFAALSIKLIYDPAARQQCIDELSIKERHTQKLMDEFEAALVLRGWLKRSNIVLEIHDCYDFTSLQWILPKDPFLFLDASRIHTILLYQELNSRLKLSSCKLTLNSSKLASCRTQLNAHRIYGETLRR